MVAGERRVGGVHVHHLFFGIVLMMVAGALSFAAGETDGPWYAIYAGVRLAKPRSVWAKRFYGQRRPDKQARAEHRFRPERLTDRCKDRVRDAIGGLTEEEYQARLAAGPRTTTSTTSAHATEQSPSRR